MTLTASPVVRRPRPGYPDQPTLESRTAPGSRRERESAYESACRILYDVHGQPDLPAAAERLTLFSLAQYLLESNSELRRYLSARYPGTSDPALRLVHDIRRAGVSFY